MPQVQSHHVKAPAPTPAERAEDAVRYVITGDRRGAMRRIVLYVLLALALVVMAIAAVGPVAIGAVLIAMGVTALLALTDQLA